MRIAIVHDYLTQRGGAERVVLSMTKAFPEAPVYTSLYDPAGTFPEFAGVDVRTSWLDRVVPLRERHRAALPLYPAVFSSLRVDADVVLCSSSGWAHGVRAARKVMYGFAPARWLYQSDVYLGSRPSGVAPAALRLLRRPLRAWDRRAVLSCDRHLTLSSVVRERFRETYGVVPEVVHPPVTLDAGAERLPVGGLEPGYHLCVSRLLPYKNVGAVVAAFDQLHDERLVIVGSGPDRDRLEAAAGPNVTFRSGLVDAELRWLYAHAASLLAVSYEDYGLTPLEAGVFGVPSVTLGSGGYLDTVVDGVTGVYINQPEPALIADAIRSERFAMIDRTSVAVHAASFDEATFITRLRSACDEWSH